MKNLSLKIEKRNNAVSKITSSINHIINTANTKLEAVNRISDILPSELKIGYGGSHIWVANQNNERLFIISGY